MLELLNQVKNNTFCLNFHKYNKNVPEAQATEKTEKKGNVMRQYIYDRKTKKERTPLV